MLSWLTKRASSKSESFFGGCVKTGINDNFFRRHPVIRVSFYFTHIVFFPGLSSSSIGAHSFFRIFNIACHLSVDIAQYYCLFYFFMHYYLKVHHIIGIFLVTAFSLMFSTLSDIKFYSNQLLVIWFQRINPASAALSSFLFGVIICYYFHFLLSHSHFLADLENFLGRSNYK